MTERAYSGLVQREPAAGESRKQALCAVAPEPGEESGFVPLLEPFRKSCVKAKEGRLLKANAI